ncbi:IS30 family transposase [Hamadaea sp. NPDC051192]|uniref:IS30 family transposase n=1 Tax=Hamadaea sp. NPDC051192 TaxID=3154940 RepID=UPI003439D231
MARAHVLNAGLRQAIENMWGHGKTFDEIAAVVGIGFSSVWREIARYNSYRHGVKNPLGPVRGGLYRWGYSAESAQRRADVRRRRPKAAKLVQPGPLRDAVVAGLVERLSPQQIAASLRRHADQELRVSHETIYQAIYLQSRGDLRRLADDELRVKRKARRSQSREVLAARRALRNRPWITEELHISARPAEAADRAVPGHWEGDLLIGAHGRSAIVTIVERASRFVLLGALPNDRTSPEVLTVIRGLFTRLPQLLQLSSIPITAVKTLAWDQGAEMANQLDFQLAPNCTVYFCDPHSPWQRGTNENTNGLLRDYFPKGKFDFTTIGQQDLDVVAAQMNRRPRQTLGWDTPAERLRQLLAPTD